MGSNSRRHYALYVYDILVHNFHCVCPNVVHPTDPSHLIDCFQRLSNTLSFHHLLDDGAHHFLCLLVNVGKVAVQLATQQQSVIKGSAVFFEIPLVSLPPMYPQTAVFQRVQSGRGNSSRQPVHTKGRWFRQKCTCP